MNLLFQKVAGLPDFEEALVFVSKAIIVNLKPTVFKDFDFDWEIYLRFYHVNCFWTLAGVELPIKHTLKEHGETSSKFLSIHNCQCAQFTFCFKH